MAMTQQRTIFFTLQGDGVTTEFDLDLSSAPFEIISQQPEVGFTTQPGFDFRVSPPTEVHSVSVSGASQPNASLSKGVLALTWAVAPQGPPNAGPFSVTVILGF